MRQLLYRLRHILMPWRRGPSKIDRLRTEVGEMRATVQDAMAEMRAKVSTLNRMLAELNLQDAMVEMRAKVSTLNRMLAELKPHILDLEGRVDDGFCLLTERLKGSAQTQANSLAPVDPDYSLAGCFERLRVIAPQAFALWRELLEVNADAYEGFPIDSCSVQGHPVAGEFRRFLRPFLNGPVLDIGCGPQPVPAYLRGYPSDLIAGLDPLVPSNGHPFTFVQGVAEYLPWDDGKFQTVVASTSMDHVLLLDRALQEIRRVLRPGGRFVTWVAFVPGAAPYDPYGNSFQKIDRFHLFHFDRPWFEQVMKEYFIMEQEYAPDGESTFLSFSPRLSTQVLRGAA